MLVFLRIIIGCLFIYSGYEKLLQPYSQFLYVIQGYEILPQEAAKWIAIALPWMEYIAGIFLVLGFRMNVSLKFLWVLLVVFILSLGQAMIRGLPLKECGCFGEGFSMPLPATLLVDSIVLILVTYLRARFPKTSRFSFDQYYSKKSSY